MKTINLNWTFFIILMFICFSGVSLYAINPEMAPAQNIQSIIRENIKYPEQAIRKSYSGKVVVIFTINDEGKIKVEKTFAENDEVEKIVKEQLSTICCKGITTTFNAHYKITITFKLLG